jgi:large subunit ribosomal protein L3
MVKEFYGKKIGMTQVFSDQGELIAVTLVEVEPGYVLDKVVYPSKTKVRIGCYKVAENRINKVKKPIRGYFDKFKIAPYSLIREVDIEEEAEKKPQKTENETSNSETPSKETKDPREIGIGMFNPGDYLNVQGTTKGKGFSGGMKRHGWAGQPKSHGSTTHRRLGSAGASAYPSRIIKGIGMPGHLGNAKRTVKKLKVLKVDSDKNILFIKGCIPGARGSRVALKKVSG